MLTTEQYERATHLAASYAAVDPTPDSVYGKRLIELRALIAEYEREHFQLTHEDVQARGAR